MSFFFFLRFTGSGDLSVCVALVACLLGVCVDRFLVTTGGGGLGSRGDIGGISTGINFQGRKLTPRSRSRVDSSKQLHRVQHGSHRARMPLQTYGVFLRKQLRLPSNKNIYFYCEGERFSSSKNMPIQQAVGQRNSVESSQSKSVTIVRGEAYL